MGAIDPERESVHTTERLILREMVTGDAPFLNTLLNEPGWIEHIGDRGVRTDEDAARYAAEGPIRSYREHGFGLYTVVTRENNRPIGICGLVAREGLDAPDLGFAFLASATGRGYATEAGRVVLDHAHARRGLVRVLAVTSPGNAASIRVLDRLGFTRIGELPLRPDGDASCLFEHRGGSSAAPSGDA